MSGDRLKRALTVNDILNKKYELLDFKGDWYDAFDQPEGRGLWFVWGNSGNGKTSFLLQMMKEFARLGKRMLMNSLEEGAGHTIHKALLREGMSVLNRKLLIVNESMEQLDIRLSKRKSPEIVFIDSFQYARMSFWEWVGFLEKHPDKLIVVISQADGKKPMGRPAVSTMYHASLKIWVEGYKAFSKGRYIGQNGGTYTIYEKGAKLYHGTE
ncbi:DNA repair protein RadA [Belliella sp. DSM 107340]|uniref:DNA repair protein RadA n=1 Tax=Belliella calami TaxID=2923436 RepID=A0ABS9UUK5_9BACT|nr:DNA repair protein RadA [Belliella calami]MCH7400095.1 DNA repair protein RadA [Belliella calami]